MLYILTEAELAKARGHLASQLRDATTLATAKGIVVDAYHQAIDQLPEDTRWKVRQAAVARAAEVWEGFPPGSDVRRYFEQR